MTMVTKYKKMLSYNKYLLKLALVKVAIFVYFKFILFHIWFWYYNVEL